MWVDYQDLGMSRGFRADGVPPFMRAVDFAGLFAWWLPAASYEQAEMEDPVIPRLDKKAWNAQPERSGVGGTNATPSPRLTTGIGPAEHPA